MDELSAASPILKARKEVDFPEAMRAVIAGNKVSKLEWGDDEVYGLLKDGFLKLHKGDGSFHQWIISDGDLLGLDWVIIRTGQEMNN